MGLIARNATAPSKKHVVFHRNSPETQSAQFMLPLDFLPRQQRLDVCAQCHSGTRDWITKGNPFSFLSGELLDDYTQRGPTGMTDQKLDVHGNQYGLLTRSKCFKETPTMDCASCHNPHENRRGDTSLFQSKVYRLSLVANGGML